MCGWPNTGTGCWVSLTGGFQKPSWTRSWAACHSWPCSEHQGWTRQYPEVPANLINHVSAWRAIPSPWLYWRLRHWEVYCKHSHSLHRNYGSYAQLYVLARTGDSKLPNWTKPMGKAASEEQRETKDLKQPPSKRHPAHWLALLSNQAATSKRNSATED